MYVKDSSNSACLAEVASKMRDVIIHKLDADKAEEICVIDLEGKTDIARYMIVASGTSMRHAKSLAENLSQELKSISGEGFNVEGLDSGQWILLDANNVIVHIFQHEIRLQYDIENLWDAEHVKRKK